MAKKSRNDVDVVVDGLSARTTVFDDPIEGTHKNGSRLIIASVEAHAPIDLVIIMLGTNDFKDQFNVNAFTSARGVLTLIQLVKGYYVLAPNAPEILIVAPPSITERAEPAYWGDAMHRSKNHASYLAQVADRTGCFFFDCNQVAAVGEDGIHLGKAGHKALGAALGDVVNEILDLSDASLKS